MSDLINKLKIQGKGHPGFLAELKRISEFPELFHGYYLSALLRTYRNAARTSATEELQSVIAILTDAGIRPATMADDVAHQVVSEARLKSKFQL